MNITISDISFVIKSVVGQDGDTTITKYETEINGKTKHFTCRVQSSIIENSIPGIDIEAEIQSALMQEIIAELFCEVKNISPNDLFNKKILYEEYLDTIQDNQKQIRRKV